MAFRTSLGIGLKQRSEEKNKRAGTLEGLGIYKHRNTFYELCAGGSCCPDARCSLESHRATGEQAHYFSVRYPWVVFTSPNLGVSHH